MDTRWLEDFLTLREVGNFTRAAEKRYVTQPAFSRRIRALEEWLDAELVDRSSYPARVSALAERYAPRMQSLLDDLETLRRDIHEDYRRRDILLLSTQASLAGGYCARWLTQLRNATPEDRIRIVAGNLYDCIDDFLAGRSDLLLCYDVPGSNPLLARADLERCALGEDEMLAVISPALLAELRRDGGWSRNPLPLVGFPRESFFGDISAQALDALQTTTGLETSVAFETSHADAVRALVVSGLGIGWLPRQLIAADVDTGRLATIDAFPAIPLPLYCFRHREARHPALNTLWEAITSIHHT